jgi:hypothetical protein
VVVDVASMVDVAIASQPSCFGRLLVVQAVVKRAVDIAEDALHCLHMFFNQTLLETTRKFYCEGQIWSRVEEIPEASD